jgi:hypothetical protein
MLESDNVKASEEKAKLEAQIDLLTKSLKTTEEQAKNAEKGK